MQTEEARPYRQLLLDEGLRLTQVMIQEAEGDPRSVHVRAEALMMKAKLLAEKGDRVDAYEYGKRAIEPLEGLLARNPADTHDRDALAEYLHQLGTIAIDRDTARSISRRSNEIYKTLLRDNPQSEQANGWTGQIAINLHNIGNAYFEKSELTVGQSRVDLLNKAIEAFREGQHFCEEQMEGGDQPDRFLFPLAYNERYLCRSHRFLASQLTDPIARTANVKKAVEYGSKAISHFQILAERNPENYQLSLELHLAQRESGACLSIPDKAMPRRRRSRITTRPERP